MSWAYFLPKTSQATICFPRIFRRGFFSKSYFQILLLSWLLGFLEEQLIQITVVNDRDSMLINSNCTKNIDHLHQPTINHKIFLKKYAYSPPPLHPRYSMLRECENCLELLWWLPGTSGRPKTCGWLSEIQNLIWQGFTLADAFKHF